MTLNFLPATLIVEPVFRFAPLAYPDSTTATFEFESDVVSVRPEVTFPEPSGPSPLAERSTPVTLNVVGVTDPFAPPLPFELKFPPPLLAEGTVPDTRMSVRFSAPAAAET